MTPDPTLSPTLPLWAPHPGSMEEPRQPWASGTWVPGWPARKGVKTPSVLRSPSLLSSACTAWTATCLQAAGGGRGTHNWLGHPATCISSKKRGGKDAHAEENTSVLETIIQCHALRGAARNIVLRNFPKPGERTMECRMGPMPCPEKLHGAASGHPCLARNETSSPWGALAKAWIISGGALGVWDNPPHTRAHI